MSKEEILELFDEIAARLSGPAEQVFEIAVRHRIDVRVHRDCWEKEKA